MDFLIVEMLKVSSVIWIFIYGWITISSELFSSCLPVSLCLIAALPLILNFIRIKPPQRSAVEAIIGRDPVFLFDEDDEEDRGYVMKSVAHRGAGLDAPENSLIAFKLCAEKGCDAVEFDVTLTADEVPIIFHDDTLERLTGSPAEVRKMTWAELSEVDISLKHPLREKFVGTHIATLDDAALQCIADNQRMIIDIKDYDFRIIPVILDLYKRMPQLYTLAICSSFFPNIIYMLRRRNPQIVCSLAWRPYFYSHQNYSALRGKMFPRTNNYFGRVIRLFMDKVTTWALPRVIYYILGISVILLHKEMISGEAMYNWRSRGIRVMAWTVNHPIEKQHFSRNYRLTYLTDTLIGEASAHSVEDPSPDHVNLNYWI